MPKPCADRHPKSVDKCYFCWLADNDRKYQKAWGLSQTAPSKRPPVPEWVQGGRALGIIRSAAPTPANPDYCIDRGDELGAADRIRLNLSHSKTWVICDSTHPLAPTGKPVCSCEGCGPSCAGYLVENSEVKYPPIGKRHLMYHLYPGRGWRERVIALTERWSVFTGDKHVAIALDDKTPSFKEVRKFLPDDAQCFEVRNDPSDAGRERISWVPLWDRIMYSPNVSDEDIVLRAHSKATRRDPNELIKGSPIGMATKWWAELSESLVLDHPKLVDDVLTRYPIAGPFKTAKYVWENSTWHYAGSYYWVRVGEAKSRKWRAVGNSTWSVESWPGREFRFEEGGQIMPFSFVGSAVEGPQHLYQQKYWETVVWPAHRKWIEMNPPSKESR